MNDDAPTMPEAGQQRSVANGSLRVGKLFPNLCERPCFIALTKFAALQLDTSFAATN
jgi:hypothetical protein